MSKPVVLVGNVQIPPELVDSFVVDNDLAEPDMAAITLKTSAANQGNNYVLRQTVDIIFDGKSIFHGMLIGVEPIYGKSNERKLILRATSNMKKHTRPRSSKAVKIAEGHIQELPGHRDDTSTDFLLRRMNNFNFFVIGQAIEFMDLQLRTWSTGVIEGVHHQYLSNGGHSVKISVDSKSDKQ